MTVLGLAETTDVLGVAAEREGVFKEGAGRTAVGVAVPGVAREVRFVAGVCAG